MFRSYVSRPSMKSFIGFQRVVEAVVTSMMFCTWNADALAEPAPQSAIIAHMFAEGGLPDQAARLFAQDVQKITNFPKVNVAHSGKLGDERDNLRQLQEGDVEFAIVGDLVLSYVTPRYRVINLHFTHRTPQQALDVYDSDLGMEVRAELREQGLEVLSWHCIGTRMLTANRAIRSKEDLKGLVLRLPPDTATMTLWKALGAEPKAVPFPQLYDTLKRGGAEAQENPPNFIQAKKFYEVQSHLMLSRHLVQRQFILASRDFIDNLDPRVAEKIRSAARKASDTVCRQALASEADTISWLKNEGKMTIIDLDLFTDAAVILPDVARMLDDQAGTDLLSRVLRIQKDAEK